MSTAKLSILTFYIYIIPKKHSYQVRDVDFLCSSRNFGALPKPGHIKSDDIRPVQNIGLPVDRYMCSDSNI